MLAFEYSARHPVDRLISVIFGRETAAALKVLYELAPEILIAPARSFPVRVETGEQSLESLRGHYPPFGAGAPAQRAGLAGLIARFVSWCKPFEFHNSYRVTLDLGGRVLLLSELTEANKKRASRRFDEVKKAFFYKPV
jgi:hypothetical protein